MPTAWQDLPIELDLDDADGYYWREDDRAAPGDTQGAIADFQQAAELYQQ